MKEEYYARWSVAGKVKHFYARSVEGEDRDEFTARAFCEFSDKVAGEFRGKIRVGQEVALYEKYQHGYEYLGSRYYRDLPVSDLTRYRCVGMEPNGCGRNRFERVK